MESFNVRADAVIQPLPSSHEPAEPLHMNGGTGTAASGTPATKKDARFWLLFSALVLVEFLAALDTSILSTALPTIVADLNSGALYIWVINSYLLASTACGPIFGQAANIVGRRSLAILAVVLFAVGSAVSGAAHSTPVLIVGRIIQGIGSGGCVVMPEIIICDLVPLRERGLYAGLLNACWSVGTLAAPVIGAVLVERASWRWIFFLNLPIAGVALLPVFMLKLRYPHRGTFWERIRRIDWIGNGILVLAVVSLLMSITWAGTENPWSSWRTIVPLVMGFVGLGGFVAYEGSPLIQEPTMPLRLFRNRTAAAVFATSFLHGMLLFWIAYFIPIYFQAVKEASPIRSAVMSLPFITIGAAAGLLAGIVTTVTGKYLPWHFIGWVCSTVGLGLFSMLDAETTLGEWVGYEVIYGFGFGVLFTTFLPAILAALSDKDVAVATATWIFIRNLGAIWGIAIPAAIFNTHADQLASSISSEEIRSFLVSGGAYEHGTAAFVKSFKSDPTLHAAIVQLYTKSLSLVWKVSVVFGGLGFLLSFFVQQLELRKEMETEFGLADKSTEQAMSHPGHSDLVASGDRDVTVPR